VVVVVQWVQLVLLVVLVLSLSVPLLVDQQRV
jgi:hypothetical protein